MVNRSRCGLRRGDRRRNEKLRRLREAVPERAAILGIDLAQTKQVAVVTGPGDQTLARRTFVCSPWGVDQMIDWGLEVAAREGLEPLVVACEPTGHRWKPVLERCRRRGVTLVCVQPLLVHREREREGKTRVSGRGRPLLRTAAWRAVWPLVHHNPVFRARYRHLVDRERNPLSDAQARAAVAAALLRQLHAVLTRREAWDPAIASGKEVVRAA